MTVNLKAKEIDMPMLKGDDISDAVIYALSTPEHVQVCT